MKQAGAVRQSVYRRLAGYEDTNDAERLNVDPVMRHVVGGRAVDRNTASTSQVAASRPRCSPTRTTSPP